MSIEFETDQIQFKSKTAFGRTQVTGMAGWLVKKGIIKDESMAGPILTGIVIFNLLLTAAVIYYFVL